MAAGPGADLRLRGRPGPRRAGLRDVSSFLQGMMEKGGGGLKNAVRKKIRKGWGGGGGVIGYRSNCIRHEQAVSPDKSGGCGMKAEQ